MKSFSMSFVLVIDVFKAIRFLYSIGNAQYGYVVKLRDICLLYTIMVFPTRYNKS